jgi:hypothetical protein
VAVAGVERGRLVRFGRVVACLAGELVGQAAAQMGSGGCWAKRGGVGLGPSGAAGSGGLARRLRCEGSARRAVVAIERGRKRCSGRFRAGVLQASGWRRGRLAAGACVAGAGGGPGVARRPWLARLAASACWFGLHAGAGGGRRWGGCASRFGDFGGERKFWG